MADNSRANLSVKVDVDVSEALTGLKALQREAKKAAQDLRGLESQEDVDFLRYKRSVQSFIGDYLRDADDQMIATNNLIYSVYKTCPHLSEIELYFPRCAGVTTSINALMEVFDDITYIGSGRTLKGNVGITDKVVFIEGGMELPRGTRYARVIRIRSIDVIDKKTMPRGNVADVANII